MEIDKELDELEQEPETGIDEAISTIKKHEQDLRKRFNSQDIIEKQEATNEKLDQLIEATKATLTEIKSVQVINPVDEVTVKNPVDSVSIKNPIDAVDVKNFPSYKQAFKDVLSAVKELPGVFISVKEAIVTALKEVSGNVRITNDRLNVQLIDPSTGKPYKAGGGSLVATGGGGGQAQLSTFRSLDLDETPEEIKASSGQIVGWYIFNNATSVRFVKIYNSNLSGTTVGTSTPQMTMPIPAQTSGGVAANALGDRGINFTSGITIAATTGAADNSTAAPGTGDVIVNIFYK